jgi:hypothetical protein
VDRLLLSGKLGKKNPFITQDLFLDRVIVGNQLVPFEQGASLESKEK